MYQERQKAIRNRDKYIGINSEGRPGSISEHPTTSGSGTMMTSSKSCSFDENRGNTFRSRRAQESIADEKTWQNSISGGQQNSVSNDIYGRINDFTNKIKNILEHHKDEDESSEDESNNNNNKPNKKKSESEFERSKVADDELSAHDTSSNSHNYENEVPKNVS